LEFFIIETQTLTRLWRKAFSFLEKGLERHIQVERKNRAAHFFKFKLAVIRTGYPNAAALDNMFGDGFETGAVVDAGFQQ
jgi:hypothetical protein